MVGECHIKHEVAFAFHPCCIPIIFRHAQMDRSKLGLAPEAEARKALVSNGLPVGFAGFNIQVAGWLNDYWGVCSLQSAIRIKVFDSNVAVANSDWLVFSSALWRQAAAP
jgi:hypothetical protein